MRAGVGFLVCFGLVAGAFGQAVQRAAPRRPTSTPRDEAADCPAAVPPTTSNSVATSTDFVELRRTRCYGTCAAYTVRVSGDGSISWSGEAFVETIGRASGAIDSNDARALMQRVADRGFWRLCGKYSRAVTDAPAFYTTLSIAGHAKTVQDYAAAAPSWVRDMDFEIDRVADTHQWRHGEPARETFGDDHLVVDAGAPKTGVTRLMKVAAAYPDELPGMLIDKTLNLNVVDSSGWTPLMYGAQAGLAEVVAMLVQAGARVDVRSNEGETALSAAVTSPFKPETKVRTLVGAGADINAADNRGVTPLMLAARHFWMPNLIATMMALGADPSKRDKDGKTAATYLEEQYKVTVDDKAHAAAVGLMTAK
jgi:hypothetical protein